MLVSVYTMNRPNIQSGGSRQCLCGLINSWVSNYLTKQKYVARVAKEHQATWKRRGYKHEQRGKGTGFLRRLHGT